MSHKHYREGGRAGLSGRGEHGRDCPYSQDKDNGDPRRDWLIGYDDASQELDMLWSRFTEPDTNLSKEIE